MSTELDDKFQASIDYETKQRGLVVTDKRSASLVPAAPLDPFLAVMDKLANNPNLDADKIERIMNIFLDGQRKIAEMEDEKKFADAMADFKKNPPTIVKSRTAKLRGTAKGSGREYEFEYSYADLNAYCEEAMPMLAERGITWSFPFSENNGQITVSCILRYGLYKHTPTTLSGVPEGGANPLQAKGVAVAYLERYTFCGATGLTAEMPDKDGKLQGTKNEPAGEMDEREVANFLDLFEAADTIEGLQVHYLKALDAAEKAKDVKASVAFANAKNKRIGQINRAQKAGQK